ncbi:cyclase dehydrase [Rhodoplanes sp. TEM]|uniref:Cyclase dehydrase n=1 Tax=Rhodoplanes tepidamans TaxID=200616 RepID=A0ABT5J963_RHOTP|nr:MULTISPECIES: cyclase dehydrase [Rhodoplanes]MDC7786007.1 cyclase dehydrase [Rhodoplanes tepidamans]MDC7984897.1 cyclase dehydrase [Rhodoplanes sp. TEM]MDQ0357026.1 hypothetical protein [Rhodoplanes tepidamans]
MLDRTRMPSASTAHALARGLGWFSLALGAAELFAPRALTRRIGLRGQEGLVQACGAREITTGIGLLTTSQPAPWLWGRVAGDVLDLATLAAGSDGSSRRRGARGLAMAAVLGVTALDVAAALAASGTERPRRRLTYGYDRRRGFRDLPDRMRGIARDAVVPKDMRFPEKLRPWGGGGS